MTTKRLPFGDWDEAGARAREKIGPVDGYDGRIYPLQIEYHRNGSGGAGFYTGFIKSGNDILMFTTFNHGGDETAVINYEAIEEKHADKKSVLGVQFMYNSLRGADYYGQAIRQFIADQRYLTAVEKDGLVKTFEWSIFEEDWDDDPTPDYKESRYYERDKAAHKREWEKAASNHKRHIEWEKKQQAERSE